MKLNTIKGHSMRRFFVFTGKGGVGKTSVALAFAKYLLGQNKKVFYCSFTQESDYILAKKVGVPGLHLCLVESTEIYVARKLGSKTLASWILKAPFFKALFNIVPPLGDMILIGHLIDLLEEDPSLHIILDGPSTGHAMSMLESMNTFRDIFKIGPLVKDIDRMLRFVMGPDGPLYIILALPTLMALNETEEFIGYLKEKEISYLTALNESLEYLGKELAHEEEVPAILVNKIEMQKEALSKYEGEINCVFDHLSFSSKEEIIDGLVLSTKCFLWGHND